MKYTIVRDDNCKASLPSWLSSLINRGEASLYEENKSKFRPKEEGGYPVRSTVGLSFESKGGFISVFNGRLRLTDHEANVRTCLSRRVSVIHGR